MEVKMPENCIFYLRKIGYKEATGFYYIYFKKICNR